MARPADPRIEAALGRVSSGAIDDGNGLWRLALTNGSVAMVTARVTSDWVELTSPLPGDAVLPGDHLTLRLNAGLHGAARFVRRIDHPQPYLRADVPLEPGGDLGEAIASACLDLAAARHAIHDGVDGVPFSWSPVAAASTDLTTRAGAYHARVEESGHLARVFVELADLSGYSPPALRAASALLMALGASVPGLTPALHQDKQDLSAVCAAPMRVRSEHQLACALAAVSAACEARAGSCVRFAVTAWPPLT